MVFSLTRDKHVNLLYLEMPWEAYAIEAMLDCDEVMKVLRLITISYVHRWRPGLARAYWQIT